MARCLRLEPCMVLKICDHVRSHVFRTVLATSVCGPGAYAPIEFV